MAAGSRLAWNLFKWVPTIKDPKTIAETRTIETAKTRIKRPPLARLIPQTHTSHNTEKNSIAHLTLGLVSINSLFASHFPCLAQGASKPRTCVCHAGLRGKPAWQAELRFESPWAKHGKSLPIKKSKAPSSSSQYQISKKSPAKILSKKTSEAMWSIVNSSWGMRGPQNVVRLGAMACFASHRDKRMSEALRTTQPERKILCVRGLRTSDSLFLFNFC